MNTAEWNDPDPAEVFHPIGDEDWRTAFGRYLGSFNDRPLLRCIEVARSHGASTVVVETRYLDLDYRSEYSAYYSKQFADVPDSAHRIHFFAERLEEAAIWSDASEAGYLGYVVVRPSTTGRVSRAMLPPPAALADAVRTSVVDRVNFFGQELTVRGVPFAQQDAQLGACAHAAAWMSHYTAYLRGEVARRSKADFALKADASLHPSRALPTGGLTVVQLSELFRTFELPAMYYLVGQLPSPGLPWQSPDPTSPTAEAPPGTWDTRIIPVACRHLNSGYPVLVGTNDHAFVLCGYQRSTDGKWIEFIRHDDQAGPYLSVHDVLNDVDPRTGRAYGPWRTMHVPLPDKLWLAPEAAERKGGEFLFQASRQIAAAVESGERRPFQSLAELAEQGRLALRTYAVAANRWKAGLAHRNLPESIRRAYALARLPRYVWVVEVIDRELRAAGEACVLGEAVLDATSSDHAPRQVALHIHGVMWLTQTSGKVLFPIFGDGLAYRSGGVGPP